MVNMITCLVDQSEHETVDAMHAHLRRFKIKQCDYYTEYLARKDLLTGDPIPFKNVDQYLSQDFLDKRHMAKWLKANPTEGRAWALRWLSTRRAEKGLVYLPSHMELRSLGGPSTAYYDTVGGYYAIGRELGFADRYEAARPVFTKLPRDAVIIEDTREQTPLTLPVKTISQKVNEGDYAIAVPHDHGVRIERKSLNDLVGTCNARAIARKKGDDSNLERFDRELARAKDAGLYLIMLVESSLTEALSFNYLPQMRWTKATPAHVFKNLRDLLTKYPLSFQVVFADGRIDAALKVMRVFEMGQQVRHLDLQYALEKGDL